MSVVKITTYTKGELGKGKRKELPKIVKRLGDVFLTAVSCVGVGGVLAAMLKLFLWGFKCMWSFLSFL